MVLDASFRMSGVTRQLGHFNVSERPGYTVLYEMVELFDGRVLPGGANFGSS